MARVSVPLTPARAAMLQDLYQMAFFHRLADTSAPAAGTETSSPGDLSDDALAAVLRDYVEILERTNRRDEAELLMDSAPSLR